MALIPESWLDDARMQRIICHWSAGGHKASDLDRRHYHILVEDDGELVRGFHRIKANERTNDGDYAAHTLGTNSGSIGVAVCCMAGAEKGPFKRGSAPMTETQWRTMAEVVAELCRHYKIPVSTTTVLGHGEVQRFLGRRQRGKWDPLVLPWDTSLSEREVGDAFRTLVSNFLEGPVEVSPPAKPKVELNGTEMPEAASANEETFFKVGDLIKALQWRLVDADSATAAFSPGDDQDLVYLPHGSVTEEEVDASASDESFFEKVTKDGYISVAEFAALLNLPVSYNVERGVLEVGRPRGDGGGGAGGPASTPTGSDAARPETPRTVKVKRGDTLSAIAEKFLGSASKWRLLRKANGAAFTEADARRLQVGATVLLPVAEAVRKPRPQTITVPKEPPPPDATGGAEAPSGGGVDAPAATTAAIELEDIINAAAGDIRRFAETSVPLIIEECAAAGVTSPAQIAYVLATSEHESKCGKFMRELWGPTRAQRGYEGRRDLGNTVRGDGFRYRGRGYVQVTGRANYKTWSDLLDLDIVRDPDLVAKDPRVAAKILVLGMRDGKFRARKLSQFINGQGTDFFNAREIINGDKRIVDKGASTSRGNRIAALAERYLAVLAAPDA